MSAYRTLDEKYLDWLYSQIAPTSIRNPARAYRSLCAHLFKVPFRWDTDTRDDNRMEDGRELRYDFLTKFKIDEDPIWMDLEISVLEVLIGLARRLSFETDEEVDKWFWTMLDNLNLRKYTDAVYLEGNWIDVDKIIDRFLDRKYKGNGEGGLFPIRHPKIDQRKVELWDQMANYLIENHEF